MRRARARRARAHRAPARPAPPAHVRCRRARARSTFDRIVDGSRNVIVRFDKEYSYGDAHDAWKEFAKTVGESSADVLVCDVGCALRRRLCARMTMAATPVARAASTSRSRSIRSRCSYN